MIKLLNFFDDFLIRFKSSSGAGSGSITSGVPDPAKKFRILADPDPNAGYHVYNMYR
jgi:hypothetical protein